MKNADRLSSSAQSVAEIQRQDTGACGRKDSIQIVAPAVEFNLVLVHVCAI